MGGFDNSSVCSHESNLLIFYIPSIFFSDQLTHYHTCVHFQLKVNFHSKKHWNIYIKQISALGKFTQNAHASLFIFVRSGLSDS